MAVASSRRNVIPSRLRDHRRLPRSAGRRPGRACSTRCARSSARATTSSSRSSGAAARARRSAAPLWDAVEAFVAEVEPGAQRGAALHGRLHRLALDARRVRHRRVRLLPVAVRPRDGGAPDPLRGRARAGGRPRARCELPALHGARRLSVRLGRCSSCTARRAHSRRSRSTWPRRGSGAASGVVADLYLGYGLSRPLRRTRRAGAARAVPRCRCSPAGSARERAGRAPGEPSERRRVGAELGRRRRTRRRSRRCARRSRAATSTR